MKLKKTVSIFLIIFTMLTFSGCNLSGTNKSEIDNRKIIAVSIVPQATFVEKVCGNNFQVVTMIPAGASPETYEPTPQEMQKLEKAEIYFAIGVPSEENVLPSLNGKTKTVKLQQGISAKYPDRKEHGGRDPHIWLSPKRMSVAISEIAEELCLLDPQNTELYKTNADKYIKELTCLDSEIKSLLETKENRKFVAFHPAFGYFAEDYNLSMYALEEHGKEATAKRLAEMVDLAKNEDIKIIFYQAEASSRQAEAFAEEIGGKAVSLEPLAADYTTNLKKMATALSEAMN